jgi:ATP-dependent exoDNAse (exonuclease V) beta subunit
MAGFLKGPFVGVRDDTLLALAEAGSSLHEAMRRALTPDPAGATAPMLHAPSEPERVLLQRAWRIVAEFGALRDRIPVHELLVRLVESTGFLVVLLHDAMRGQQAIANVRKLVRTARGSADASLGEFLRQMAEARARGTRVGEERLYRERGDVVTITSVHSAKGLEWPVVFWCDLVREPRADSSALLCGRTVFRLRDADEDADGKKMPDLEHEALQAGLALESLAESYRLWYVASTRPQRLLVLSGIPLGTAKKEDKSVSGLVRTTFSDALSTTPLPRSIAYAHADGTTYQLMLRSATADVLVVAEERTAWHAEVTLPPAAALAPTGRMRLSATQLMSFDSDADAWWQQYVFAHPHALPAHVADDATGDASRRAWPDPMRLGTIVHAVLEQYNYELDDIDEVMERAIAAADDGGPETDTADGGAYRAQIRALVERAVHADAWKAVATQPTARRELAFTRILPSGGTVEGKFDLAAITPDGVRILDAKTGSPRPAAELAARYAVQAASYAEAAGAITGRDAVSFALLVANDGSLVEVPANAASVQEIVRRLRAYGRE